MKIKKGFTLIEIIAVMAIISIIAAIIIPKVITHFKEAEKSKDLANARTIITSVDLYNIEYANDSLRITPDKTLEEVKVTILGANPQRRDYVGHFPETIKVRRIEADGTIQYIDVKDDDNILKNYKYSELINYVENPNE